MLEQWVERLSQFLGLSPKEIGRWGGGRKKLNGSIDVALMQSLVRHGSVQDLVADYGHLVVDECHHLPARRLESLPDLAGRFRLNVSLPIPFDDNSRMEVDLFCEQARLVIEIDGSQHLADPVAYRRDRRKDALLQAHGYFILRFLADDLGKDLDLVLDTILRTLAHLARAQTGL